MGCPGLLDPKRNPNTPVISLVRHEGAPLGLELTARSDQLICALLNAVLTG